jgi:tetratricopeptide (TPR) repeat protein
MDARTAWKRPSMPGKEPRALCPVCQEPLPPDETECRHCGAFVIDEALVRLGRAFGIDREKALRLVDAGFRHPLQLRGRDVNGVLERRESGLLFLCTNCGSFVAGQEAHCARCGAVFEAATEESIDFGAEDILDLLMCQYCGADNEPTAAECDICGHPLPVSDRVLTPEGASRGSPAEEEMFDEELASFDALARDLEDFDERGMDIPEDYGRPVAVGSEPSRRIVKTAAEIRVRRPDGPADRPPGRTKVLPRDILGSAVAASAAGILAAYVVRGSAAAWGIAGILAGLVAYTLVRAFPFRRIREDRREAGSLLAGTALSLLAPILALAGTGDAAAFSLSALGAGPLAWVTSRVGRRPDRTLLAVAGGTPMIGLAVAVALGHAYAGSAAWGAALLLSIPWPILLAFDEVRRHWFARELDARVERAERAYRREDFSTSIQEFDRAIRLAANRSVKADLPWYGKGAALTILGQYEQALRAIDQALDINPMNEVAWVNQGNALTRTGRLVDALRSFNTAIRVNPAYEVAWNNKGNALARLGQYEESLRCYDKAIDLDPRYRGAWVNRGFVLAKLGRFDEAAACADRVLELSGLRMPERP